MDLSDIEKERLQRLEEACEGRPPGEILMAFGPDSFGRHELLDRLHVFSHLWENLIMDHTSTLSDEQFYKLACEIETLIGGFYSEVGRR